MLINRPAMKYALPLIAGIIIGWYCEIPLLYSALSLLILFILSLIFFIAQKKDSFLRIYFTLALIVLLGIVKISVDGKYFSKNLIIKFTGYSADAMLEGIVTDPPRKKSTSIQFVVEVDKYGTDVPNIRTNGGVLVSIPIENISESFIDSLQYGMRILFQGQLQSVSTARNPGDFDLRKYLFLNEIYAKMYLEDQVDIQILGKEGNFFLTDLIYPLRKLISKNFTTYIGGKEASFLKGILIGDRSEIPFELKESFINAGVMHILAVSGLHVGMITAIIFVLLSFFRFSRKICIIGTSLILVFYIFLTGHPPSVVRASVMAIIILMSFLLERKVDVFNSLAVAAIILLFIDAKQLFEPGFQLSFIAVIAIVALYPKIHSVLYLAPEVLQKSSIIKFFSGLAAVSFAAAIGTIPFTSYYFGKISIIGFAANLIIVPMTGIILALGIITSIFAFISNWAADIFAQTTKASAGFLLYFVSYFGNLKYSHIFANFNFLSGVIFYVIIGFIFTLRNGIIVKRFIFAFLIVANGLIFYSLLFEKEENFKVTFLDVGQGDAIFIEFPDGKNMLVDAGPRTFYRDAGERFIKQFLNKKGIRKIDYILNTHPHYDHLGGIPSLLRKFKVGTIIDAGSYEKTNIFAEYKFLIDSLDIKYRVVKQGSIIQASDLSRIYVLHPAGEFDSTQTHDLNDQSIVLKIVYKETSLMLTGDIERKSEIEILNQYSDFLKTDILKNAHHGSKTSNTEEFLDQVAPEYALISAGFNNKFNHPSDIVLERLNDKNIKIHRTDLSGAALFESNGKKWKQIIWK